MYNTTTPDKPLSRHVSRPVYIKGKWDKMELRCDICGCETFTPAYLSGLRLCESCGHSTGSEVYVNFALDNFESFRDFVRECWVSGDKNVDKLLKEFAEWEDIKFKNYVGGLK